MLYSCHNYLYQDFVKQAEAVEPFSTAFDELLKKMLAQDAYTGDGLLLDSLRDHQNTTRLLETKVTKLRHMLGSPDLIIDALKNGSEDKLFAIAYLTKALQTLHQRCVAAEQEVALF